MSSWRMRFLTSPLELRRPVTVLKINKPSRETWIVYSFFLPLPPLTKALSHPERTLTVFKCEVSILLMSYDQQHVGQSISATPKVNGRILTENMPAVHPPLRWLRTWLVDIDFLWAQPLQSILCLLTTALKWTWRPKKPMANICYPWRLVTRLCHSWMELTKPTSVFHEGHLGACWGIHQEDRLPLPCRQPQWVDPISIEFAAHVLCPLFSSV